MISQLILSVSFFAGKFLQPLECFLPSLRGSLLRPKAGSSQSGSYVLYRAMKSLFGLVDTDTYFVMAAGRTDDGAVDGEVFIPRISIWLYCRPKQTSYERESQGL